MKNYRRAAEAVGIAPPAGAVEVADRVGAGLPVSALERVCRLLDLGPDFKYRLVAKPTLAQRKKARQLSADESGRLVRIVMVWEAAKDVWETTRRPATS